MRPTRMGSGNRAVHPALVLCVVGLLVLAGCADAEPRALFGDCTAGDRTVRRAARLLEVDLDGDGHRDTVRFTGRGAGACRDAVLAEVGGVTTGVSLHGTGLEPDSARAVVLAGKGPRLLLVRGRPHPRGGYQPHLLGWSGHRLREVTVDGRPLLPFVATDGGGRPTAVECTEHGRLGVVSATVHEPPGIVLAWDVRRTSYTVHRARVVGTTTRTLRSSVADPVLREEMPRLFGPRLLLGCGPGPGVAVGS